MQIDPRFETQGTAFVLYFHPFCDVHQQGDGKDGNGLRQAIADRVMRRFLVSARRALSVAAAWQFKAIGKTDLRHRPCSRIDNGEFSIWLDGEAMSLETMRGIMEPLWESFEKDPIRVALDGEEFTVRFCGYGFRHMPAAKDMPVE